MKKGQVFLLGAASFLAGVAAGIIISPVKNGIGNNSGNSTHYHYGERNCGHDECGQDCCCEEQDTEADCAASDEEDITV